MENSITEQSMIQNLKDAGCDCRTVEKFLTYRESGDVKKQLQLLSEHRRQLLSRVHREEQRIDCLDYLVYQIRQDKV